MASHVFFGNPLLRFSVGTLSAFYGRHFTYVLLYAQVYALHGRPFLQRVMREVDLLIRLARENRPRIDEATAASRDAMRQLSRLQEAYARASAEGGDPEEAAILQRELLELQEELQFDVLRLGTVGRSILGAMDPHRIMLALRGLCAGFVSLASAATSNGAQKVGVGFDISERAANAIYRVVAPLVHEHAIPWLCEHSAELRRLHDDDQRLRRYVDVVVVALCSSVGVGVAFHLERAVFVAANCVWGAELILSAASQVVRQLLPRTWDASLQRAMRPAADGPGARRARAVRISATLLLATSGAFYQFSDGLVDAALPAAMRVVLFAPLLTERWLQTATLAVRGPLAGIGQAVREG